MRLTAKFLFGDRLRNQLEKSKHETALQVTQLKLDGTRSRGTVERERDNLVSQVEGG